MMEYAVISFILTIICLVWTRQVSGTTLREGFKCNVQPKLKHVFREKGDLATRSFLLNEQSHWPNAEIPFEIESTFNEEQIAFIVKTIEMFHNISCVRWVPHYEEMDYVVFTRVEDDKECSSNVGRMGGVQYLNLGDDCYFKSKGFFGAVAHEMMHTMGFIHEQQRIDRDCYVNVAQWAVVNKESDFGTIEDTDTDFPYDLNSIMHYGTSQYLSSKNKKQRLGTLYSRHAGELTPLDVMKLNFMYCGGSSYCDLDQEGCAAFEKARKQCNVTSSIPLTRSIYQPWKSGTLI